MRAFLVTLTAAAILAGCTQPQAPNDQDQYFDNITPDPVALEAENARLQSAQSGETVLLPGEGTSANVAATPQAVAVATENAEISNTQDFKAVTQKETIASDAAKLAALKQNYKVVEPEALPTRRDTGPNLAAYALSQKHEVGTKKFRRLSLGSSGCDRYRRDPDAAQRAFLEAGGPSKDRKRLDGDGDGFACSWDPNTYRRLLSSANG